MFTSVFGDAWRAGWMTTEKLSFVSYSPLLTSSFNRCYYWEKRYTSLALALIVIRHKRWMNKVKKVKLCRLYLVLFSCLGYFWPFNITFLQTWTRIPVQKSIITLRSITSTGKWTRLHCWVTFSLHSKALLCLRDELKMMIYPCWNQQCGVCDWSF